MPPLPPVMQPDEFDALYELMVAIARDAVRAGEHPNDRPRRASERAELALAASDVRRLLTEERNDD